MKKITVSVILILVIISTIVSVSYAWFTYVERKSLATFEAGVLEISLKANDEMFMYDLAFDDLAFIDFESEVVLDQYQTLNHLASSIKVDLTTDLDAPLSRHKITIDETNLVSGLIYVIVYDGVNVDPLSVTTDYHTYIANIISGYLTKTEQMNAIIAHNAQVLNEIYNQTLFAEDTLTFQVVMWGDYDTLTIPENYLDETFILSLKVESINDKGDVNP
jgi:hypothetical protein